MGKILLICILDTDRLGDKYILKIDTKYSIREVSKIQIQI